MRQLNFLNTKTANSAALLQRQLERLVRTRVVEYLISMCHCLIYHAFNALSTISTAFPPCYFLTNQTNIATKEVPTTVIAPSPTFASEGKPQFTLKSIGL